MEKIEILVRLENISSKFPNRLLKLEGYAFKEAKKEKLEIIIFKGFSSSTTHPIEINIDKKVIEFDHFFTNFKLFKAPLIKDFDNFLRENKNALFFLNQDNWL